MAAVDPSFDARTLDGWTLDQILTQVNELAVGAAREIAARPPDPKGGSVTKRTGQVVSVSDDGVDVQIDTDPNGHVTHCSSIGSPNISDRVVVFYDPSGGAVAVSGGAAQTDAPSAPVQIQPATPYVPVTVASLPLVAEGATPTGGVLKGAWNFIGGGPWVVFSIELLFGTNGTGVPTFILPRLPVGRRHVFNAHLIRQPGTHSTPLYAYSGFDGSTTAITVDVTNGTDVAQPLTTIFPGGLNAGASRLDITGVYEAAT